MIRFESERLRPDRRHVEAEPFPETPRRDLDSRDTRRFRRRLYRVAGIDDQHQLAAEYQQHAGRSAESREVADVRRVRHEQRVEPGFLQPVAQRALTITPAIGPH